MGEVKVGPYTRQAYQDQVNCNDVIQEPWDQKDQDTRNQCDKWLKRNDVNGHLNCSVVGRRLTHRALGRGGSH